MSMQPLILGVVQNVRMLEGFGGLKWKDQTTIHPLALVMVLVCGVMLLSVKRAHAVWPFIIMACFVSGAQRLVVFTLDFNLIRIMVLFGAFRIAIKSEYKGFQWSLLDTLIISFVMTRTLVYSLQQQTISAFIYQAGSAFDAFGIYFLMRCFLRTTDDIIRTVMGFAYISVTVALFFINERLTRHNVFAVFGGVREITAIREGRLRCQGPFAHPIMAGCFWASLIPLFVAMWWQGTRQRMLSIVSSLCALGVVLLCASSTPVMGVIAGLLGAAAFYVRWWMRWIFAGACVMLVALHFSMKAPVWHLISRITISRGNTGYHRYRLIDSAITRFDEWWLLGSRSTAHWFWGGQDVTNQFILEGIRGGFATLVLFCSIIGAAFYATTTAWRQAGARQDLVILSWALWTTLFVHCVNFIGVSYFGQVTFLWYLHLAMAVSASQAISREAAKQRSNAGHDLAEGAPILTYSSGVSVSV